MSNSEIDFDIPGPMPLIFRRHYRSTNIWRGDLGYGWGHSFGLQLWQDNNTLMFRGSDGRRIPFSQPEHRKPSFQRSEHLSLFLLLADELPWPKLQMELRAGAYALQTDTEFSFIFDAQPLGTTHPWRGVIDHAANLISIVPGTNGYPMRIEHPRGHVLEFFRNKDGSITEIQLSQRDNDLSRFSLVRFEYSSEHDLVAVHDMAGRRTYEYREHRLVKHRNRCGVPCETVYDATGRCVRTSRPTHVLERTYEYSSVDQGTVVVGDSFGHSSIFEHSERQQVIRTTDQAGGISTFDYDGLGRLVRATDQLRQETTICYNADGAQVAKVRPDGSVIALETDSLGKLMRIITAAGAITRFRRDACGRVVEITRPRRGVYRFTYADTGEMTGVTLPTGKEVFLQWTPDGRTLKETDVGGLLTSQRFDDLGRLTRIEDAIGAVTQYGYGPDGYLNEVIHPDSTRRRFVHDAEGHLLEFYDEAGATTKWGYDEVGRCRTVTLPIGDGILCEYDSENHLIAVRGPDDSLHRYQYDPRGLVIRQEFSDGRLERYEYDATGLLIKMIDSSGGQIEADRDSVGRLTRISYPDGSEKTIQTDLDGRWLQITYEGDVLEREITDDGYPVVERRNDFTLKREFGPAGEIQSITDSFGRKVLYGYNPDGRVTNVQIVPGAWKENEWQPIASPRVHRFQYDRGGNIAVWEMPAGKLERRRYDLRHRLIDQTISVNERVVLQRQYTYDACGRVSTIRDSRRGEIKYSYDALGRLQSVHEEGKEPQSFDYSRSGDLLLRSLQYGQAHRVRRVDGFQLDYDNRGFVVRRGLAAGSDTFDYTTQGLLRQAKLADGTEVNYAYDGRSRLLCRSVASRQCRYYWNDEQVWTIHLNDSNAIEFSYLPGALSPFEHWEGGQAYSIHCDHLGKIQELIDNNGNIVWANTSGSWGEGRRPVSDTGTQPDCPFGFPGQIWDDATGLFYNRYRWYFAESAHYLTPDPIGIWGGFDAYRFLHDPINALDPNGLKCRGKTDDDILYRSDDRPPDEICRDGFAPQNPNAGLTVAQHVEGCPPGGSNWISTTHSADWAENATLGGDRVYVILNPGCGVEVDCDPDMIKKYGPDPPDSEHEIAFNKAIPPGKIVGWFSRSAGGMASFQACP